MLRPDGPGLETIEIQLSANGPGDDINSEKHIITKSRGYGVDSCTDNRETKGVN